jgi:osmotically inducible protein OsmC
MTQFSRFAEIEWTGDVMRGNGRATAGTEAFAVPITFPSTSGEAPGKTTPEELLAASHATCFGIGLCSVIGRRGGSAHRVTVSATATAEKGPNGIQIQSSHLSGVVEFPENIDDGQIEEIAREVAEGCTISNALRGNVRITHEIKAHYMPGGSRFTGSKPD